MTLKIQIFIGINILLFICYKIVLNSTKIKGNYDKWKDFYEKYNSPPFSYIDNILPFSPDDLFFRISRFVDKLSFFIANFASDLKALINFL